VRVKTKGAYRDPTLISHTSLQSPVGVGRGSIKVAGVLFDLLTVVGFREDQSELQG
jgi:hypothetical protein